MANWLAEQLNNINEDDIRRGLQDVDPEHVRDLIDFMVDEYIVPHLEDIKQNAENHPDSTTIRQKIGSMPEEDREDQFYDELDELVAIFAEIRERPREGLISLKDKIRDPVLLESLLLTFENEQPVACPHCGRPTPTIDPGYSDQLKNFWAEHSRWIGVFLLPEIYTQEEIRQVVERFDLDMDAVPDPGDGPGTSGQLYDTMQAQPPQPPQPQQPQQPQNRQDRQDRNQ